MKKKFKIIIGASAASAMACTIFAQQAINPNTDQTGSAGEYSPQASGSGLKGACKASEDIGRTVENYQHEKLGKVNDLVLDVQSGRIVQVILASGGILGVGDTYTAVPPGALHHEAGSKIFGLDASREKFNAAPKFNTANWDTETQSNQVTEVYGYYGEHPYFAANDGSWNANANGASANGKPTAEARSMGQAAIENGGSSAGSNLGYLQKESKLVGAPVWNRQDEKLGKVENFIINLPAGRLVAVIISSGGFLGIDGELSAIPPTALQFNGEHNGLQLDSTKETLANSPHFRKGEWPDFSQRDYTVGVYHAYHVEPYFGTNISAEADNTRQNMRDRDNSTLTPLDQSNSQPDINTTAQIRKEILAAGGMSTNAKNVKIITQNGRVTLRGPVASEDEKRQIGEIATRIAQSGNVDNQLEVAPTTTSSVN